MLLGIGSLIGVASSRVAPFASQVVLNFKTASPLALALPGEVTSFVGLASPSKESPRLLDSPRPVGPRLAYRLRLAQYGVASPVGLVSLRQGLASPSESRLSRQGLASFSGPHLARPFALRFGTSKYSNPITQE